MDDLPRTTWPTRRTPSLALLGANAISETGNVVAFVAIPWFVLQTTGSAAKTGLTGGAFLLAAVGAGVVGPVVDRLGFKRASIVADLAGAVTVALIPLIYHTIGLIFWQLLVLVFLGGFFDAPGHTARQSLVPDLARRARMRIERANSAFQGIQHASFLLGPLLAGVLIAVFTPSNVLWLDAATFVISAALVAALVPSVAPRAGTAAAELRPAGGYLAELAEGITFIRRDRLVFWMFGIGVVANFLILPLFAVVLPVYAKQTYGSAVNLGLMLGSFGSGALAGTVFYGAVGHLLPRRATLVSAIVDIGLPFWVLVTTPSLVVTMGALFVAGLRSGRPTR